MGLISPITNFVASTYGAVEMFWKQPNLNLGDRAAPVISALIKGGASLYTAGEDLARGDVKKAKESITGGPKEPPFDIRKAIPNSNKLKTISTEDLIAVIGKDSAFPATLNLQGQEMTLAEAMEDRSFRAGFIQKMTGDALKDPSLKVRVAVLREYSARLNTAEQDAYAAQQQKLMEAAELAATLAQTKIETEREVVETAPTPTSTPQTGASFASALAPKKPSAESPYHSMTAAQLVSTIRDDPTLPETAKVGDVDIRLSSALRDPDFRRIFVEELDKAKIEGIDTSKQIEMIRAYGTALTTEQATLAMAQTAKLAAHAPALTPN